MTMRNVGRLLLATLAAAALAGCASTRAPDPRDPWEPVNRATFEFNDTVDKVVLKPIAQGYHAVLPSPIRSGVRNFFANLRDPWIAVNQFLQGKVEEGLSDLWRFIANSTFGLGGLCDIASDMGMPKHNEDFGQTLAVWGIGFGPYLVIPILGPSSVRDGVGTVADVYTYLPYFLPEWLDFEHRVAWSNSLTALDLVQRRSDLLDATTAFEQAALDRYAFLRAAYFQRRRNLIYDGNPPPEQPSDSPDSPSTGVLDGFVWLAGEARDSDVAESGLSPNVVDPKVPANYRSVLTAGADSATP